LGGGTRGPISRRVSVRSGNIYSAAPKILPEEFSEALVDSGKVRIERIISHSNSSPEGFWYDQEDSEWVMVLEGEAGLKIEGKEELLVLKPGDWVDIPAHVKHRVEWTDKSSRTVWLAVFYQEGTRDPGDPRLDP
jgi:cupin 2 domain-containing protein